MWSKKHGRPPATPRLRQRIRSASRRSPGLSRPAAPADYIRDGLVRCRCCGRSLNAVAIAIVDGRSLSCCYDHCRCWWDQSSAAFHWSVSDTTLFACAVSSSSSLCQPYQQHQQCSGIPNNVGHNKNNTDDDDDDNSSGYRNAVGLAVHATTNITTTATTISTLEMPTQRPAVAPRRWRFAGSRQDETCTELNDQENGRTTICVYICISVTHICFVLLLDKTEWLETVRGVRYYYVEFVIHYRGRMVQSVIQQRQRSTVYEPTTEKTKHNID